MYWFYFRLCTFIWGILVSSWLVFCHNVKFWCTADSSAGDWHGSDVFRRSGDGVRVFWDRLREPSFISRWNPFATDFPFSTFTYHPVRNTSDTFESLCDVSPAYMSSRARCCIKELVNLDFKHNIKIGFLSSTLCVSLIGLNHWIYLKMFFFSFLQKK